MLARLERLLLFGFRRIFRLRSALVMGRVGGPIGKLLSS
jgi:hypothetical protein